MMKCIFVVVLLQLCHSIPLNTTLTSSTPDVTTTSFTPDPNLNGEILNDLRELKKNVSHAMLKLIPGPYMLTHPSKCVYTFSQNLTEFLKKMTLEVAVEKIIERLVPKLETLAKHPQNDSKCIMTKASKTNFFQKHMEFIKKLNSRR